MFVKQIQMFIIKVFKIPLGIFDKMLPESLLCNVHYFLWRSGALDGSVWEGKHSISTILK